MSLVKRMIIQILAIAVAGGYSFMIAKFVNKKYHFFILVILPFIITSVVLLFALNFDVKNFMFYNFLGINMSATQTFGCLNEYLKKKRKK